MRGLLVGLLMFASCYTPAIPSGVQCAPNGACPDGQTCVVNVCVRNGALDDAGIDGDTSANDRDGDRVVNADDNCPDVGNADQANEDRDRFGDACDPCPPDRNDTPNDPDGDGVADSCDPNPNVNGDAIQLFEGFRGGLPAWSPSPNWAAVTGEAIEVKATINAEEFILVPATQVDRVTVTASLSVTQLVGTFEHEIGLAVPYEASSYLGIGCDLVDEAGRFVGMWDDFGDDPLGATDFPWLTNTEYRLSMVHHGTSYTCTAIEPSGTRHSVPPATSSSTTASPGIALRAYAVTARVSWVMIVRSP